jgi:hypothetical protein
MTGGTPDFDAALDLRPMGCTPLCSSHALGAKGKPKLYGGGGLDGATSHS